MALIFVERSEKLSEKTACDVNVGQVKKKQEIQNRVFRVDLAQKWFVRTQTWKEQAICLQKLQAVVITFLIFFFFCRRIHNSKTDFNDIY